MKQLDLFSNEDYSPINYLVTTQGFSGYKETGCATIEEARIAFGNCSMGALRSVTSPTGLDVSRFIPF